MPGVDCLEYTDRRRDGVVRVMAHCRPSTPRRGWAYLSRVLNAVSRHADVEIVTYDEDPIDLWVSNHKHLGRVSPSELAIEMGRADIFVEGSDIQGFGMQALEAMACGCALVCRSNRGIDTFGVHGYDCMIVDDEEKAIKMINVLIKSEKLRTVIGDNAQNTASSITWDFAANEWAKLLKG
jgi:glycosyltransferase involved in cell wall biosynthesis